MAWWLEFDCTNVADIKSVIVCVTFDPPLANLICCGAEHADVAAGINQRTVSKRWIMTIARNPIVLKVSEPEVEIDDIVRRAPTQPGGCDEWTVQRIANCVVTFRHQRPVAISLVIAPNGRLDDGELRVWLVPDSTST